MSHYHRPYQGFPYTSPDVLDAPTLSEEDIAARARWNDLPRRLVSNLEKPATPAPAQDPTPVVYIEIPEATGSGLTQPVEEPPASPQPARPAPKAPDPSPPVVYIDLPEPGSALSQTREEEGEPEYVQNTIYYDQFKDRRIEVASSSSSSSSSPVAGPSRPTALELESRYQNSLPVLETKEAQLYGQSGSPTLDFPPTPERAPPPPYEEVERQDQEAAPAAPAPQRTIIILPNGAGSPLTPGGDRKVLHCSHCGQAGTTLMVEETGAGTHLAALLVFIFFMPFVLLVYCCGLCRYQNYYCPHCNKKIAYTRPMSRGKLRQVS